MAYHWHFLNKKLLHKFIKSIGMGPSDHILDIPTCYTFHKTSSLNDLGGHRESLKIQSMWVTISPFITWEITYLR